MNPETDTTSTSQRYPLLTDSVTQARASDQLALDAVLPNISTSTTDTPTLEVAGSAADTENLSFFAARMATFQEFSHAAQADIQNSGKPRRTLALGALALGTQVIDRMRTVVLLVPPAVVSTMEGTNNPWIAGAVGAGLYAGINFGNGEGLTHGLAAYPKTTETFNNKYPGVVSLFEQSLPGISKSSVEKSQSPEQLTRSSKLGAGIIGSVMNSLKTAPGKLGLHVRRSMAGISLGSTAFVATDSTRGSSIQEVRKTNAKVTADGAVGVYALGASMTWGIRELAMRGHMETADKLQGVVESRWTWYGVAALSVIGEWAANRKKNREIQEGQMSNIGSPNNEDDILASEN